MRRAPRAARRAVCKHCVRRYLKTPASPRGSTVAPGGLTGGRRWPQKAGGRKQ